MNILLVDDDADILKVMSKLLKLRGHSVQTCSSPFGVSAQVMRDQPDVVVLDVEMPGLEGPKLASVIGRLELPRRPVVVLCSAVDDDTLKRAGIEAGGLPTISKVLRPQAIVDEIERLGRDGA